MSRLKDPPRRYFLPKRQADYVAVEQPVLSPDPNAPSLPPRLALHERLMALAGVRSRETPLVHPNTTTYYVAGEFASESDGGRKLLCRSDDHGILFGALSRDDRAEILRSRWGRQQGDSIVVWMARDEIELEIVWRCVLMAYRNVTRPALETRCMAGLQGSSFILHRPEPGSFTHPAITRET